MDGRLTYKDMDQLETWIGTGPKTFTLLYAKTRDGGNAKVFHEKCDYKGPTVTVEYTTNESVYGGYNPTSWNSDINGFVGCHDAFLFHLRFKGYTRANKFTLKKHHYRYAIKNHAMCGPTFGNTDRNPHTDIFGGKNRSFDFKNVYCADVDYDMPDFGSDDNSKVTELEVYKVEYDEKKERTVFGYISDDEKKERTVNIVKTPHWRATGEWNRKLLLELKKEVVEFKPVPGLDISVARILMIGPVGSGKSSFCNTIGSIFRGRIVQRARSGSADESLTPCYFPYSVKVASGERLRFRLCDTPGLEESHGINVMECSYLLDGNIPDFYEFNPTSPITPKNQGFKTQPTTQDAVHCTVFVIDGTTLDVLSTKIMEKIKEFQNLMNARDIPQTVLLTKVDKLCKKVDEDMSNLATSKIVEEHVDKASQLFGLPRNNILPIKNYEKELGLDEKISILALLSLRHILHLAEDYMLNMEERKTPF